MVVTATVHCYLYLNVIIEDIQEFQAFKLTNGFWES